MNSLIIAGSNISVNAEGLFCINDLHKASGGALRHKPKEWLKSGSVMEMADLILKGGINPFKTEQGRYGGTYVCKEMVYSYAMWVSAEFALHVIRTFDRAASGEDLGAASERYMQLDEAIECARIEQAGIKCKLNRLGLEPINKVNAISTNEREVLVARLVAEHGIKQAKAVFVEHSDAPTSEAARKRFERSLVKCRDEGLI